MSLKGNVLANYASQIYVTSVGILVLPFYIRYMGVEAYGLVGFFSMMQAWFNLLDLGLSPTIARETARFQVGALDRITYSRLLRALQILFVLIALIGGAALFLMAGYLSGVWLKLENLLPSVVQVAIELMAGSVALRWMSGLYRGIISGAEKFVWLSGFNTLIATLRFLGVIPVLAVVGATPPVFFSYQLVVAALELAGLLLKARSLRQVLMAEDPSLGSPRALINATAPVLRFALGSAFTTIVWVLVTQIDKLILSNLIPLTEYGFYTLAVLVAGGITMIWMPITNSVQPRITKLHAEKNQAGEFALYRKTTQLVMIMVIPATAIMIIFPEVLLRLWTNNLVVAAHSANILRLYALGNVILSINVLPLLLQFASGNLRMHVIGNFLFAVIYLPFLVIATRSYGTIGACWAWLGLNLISFLFWLPYIHKTFFHKNHFSWLRRDVGVIGIFCCLPATILAYFVHWTGNRLADTAILVACGAFLFVMACAGSSLIRAIIWNAFISKKATQESRMIL